jgi:hypothetical protein
VRGSTQAFIDDEKRTFSEPVKEKKEEANASHKGEREGEDGNMNSYEAVSTWLDLTQCFIRRA